MIEFTDLVLASRKMSFRDRKLFDYVFLESFGAGRGVQGLLNSRPSSSVLRSVMTGPCADPDGPG